MTETLKQNIEYDDGSRQEWNFYISGFLQWEDKLPGITRAYIEGRDICYNRAIANGYKRFNVECRHLRWNADMKTQANFVQQIRQDGPMPIIRIFCYSWGGQTAMNFAKLLRDRGIDVRVIVATDPVWRCDYMPLNFRVLFPTYPIKVPDNVKEVFWFRQREGQPMGHDLVPMKGNKRTVIHNPITLTVTHPYMDDHPSVRQKFREALLLC